MSVEAGGRDPHRLVGGQRAPQREDWRRRRVSIDELRDREDFKELRHNMRGVPRELWSLNRAVTVEAMMSMVLNGWRQSMPEDVAPEDTEYFLVDLAISHATEPGLRQAVARIYGRETVALLHAISAIADAEPAQYAREALAETELPEVQEPSWATEVGKSQLVDCAVVDHELGDETEVVFAYRYGDESPHGLGVTVNHSLGGIVTHVWVDTDGEQVLQKRYTDAEEEPRRTVSKGDPATVRALLTDAFDMTSQAENPPVSEGYQNLHTLALARLSTLPEGERPAPPVWSELDRSDLVADFVTSPEAHGLPAESAEAIATELVEYGAEHDRGQALRVSATKLRVFLLGWLPRTGLLSAQHVDHVPDVVPAWVRYAARRTGLSEASLTETLDELSAITSRFKQAYEDPERWSPERASVERILADIEPTEQDADEVIARRMFALSRFPDPDFDPSAKDAFAPLIEGEPSTTTTAVTDVRGEGPKLTSALHIELARQLWFNDPPETWSTAQRLLDAGMERSEVLQALGFALGSQTQHRHNGVPFDRDAYRTALEALPESWHNAQ